MREIEAYPDGRTYAQRSMERFQPGDLVRMGARYQMGGAYVADNYTGIVFTVIRELSGSHGVGGSDYYLVIGHLPMDQVLDTHWDVISKAVRLVRVD